MANNFTLAKNYVPLLDEVYQKESVTSDLVGDPNMQRAGVNANEIVYPQIEVSGLGDYSRSSGYTDGSVKLDWVTTQFNYDRGTKISVDVMDDEETFHLSFGRAGAELIRTKVAPEADAFCFAHIAGLDGVSKATGTISSAADFLTALITAKNKMDEDEVPEEGRILYATSTLLNSLMSLDTYKSREVLGAYEIMKGVPQKRFYTAIDMLDGKTTGETAGHYKRAVATYEASTDASVAEGKTYYTESGGVYTKVASPTGDPATSSYYEMVADAGKDINFMIIHKPALIKYDKHIANDLISPANNPDSDAYILKYRKYGIVDVYANKRAGIYLHHKA